MSTTALQALQALRDRLSGVDSGVTIPVLWNGDPAPVLPDQVASFGFAVFNNDGSGDGPIEFGGGRGRNRFRNRGSLEVYVFAPNGEGLTAAMSHAETVAARLRSFRDDAVSCMSADVIPVGQGSSIAPPGFTSDVTLYQCAVAEVLVTFDQIG